jgi:aminoglycoside phosphotransferase (APT) family kinase protein
VSAPDRGRNALLDTSGRPDAAPLGASFARWARDHLAPGLELRRAAFPAEGGSSYNLLVDLEDACGPLSLVVKLATPRADERIFPDEDLFRQSRVMRLVATATDLPVPAVLSSEADPSQIGIPFLVLRRCLGRAWPSDPPYTFTGWVLDLPPDTRMRMQHNLIEVLARIHAVTADRYDLAEFGRPGAVAAPLAALLAGVREHYKWGRAGRAYPLLERALARLEAELPTRSEPPCLTWGDARAGNLLFTGTDVTAVLDWEGAGPGYGEVDLAFVAIMHRYYQDRAEAHGLPGLPECFRPEDLARDYAAASGREPAELGWYLLLAAARAAAIQVRFLARRYAAGDAAPEDPDAALGVAGILRRLLDTGRL